MLDNMKNMAASRSQNEEELVEESRSEIHGETQADDEEKKES